MGDQEIERGAAFIVQHCMRVRPGEEVLIVSDDRPPQLRIAGAMRQAAEALGARASIGMMTPLKIAGDEPPRAIAGAMKHADAIAVVVERVSLGHTRARVEANAAGARVFTMPEVMEEDLTRQLRPEDLEQIRACSEEWADRFTRAKAVRATTKAGTDITLCIEGRNGFPLHPIGQALSTVPDFGETFVPPVEGTARGRLVIDVTMVGWKKVLREPLVLRVQEGRVTEITGDPEDAERLRKILATDAGASTIAEFAIGTSHTIPRCHRGTLWDAGILGHLHIGIGRNIEIGGRSDSRIHIDGVMQEGTIFLDGKCVLQDGLPYGG